LARAVKRPRGPGGAKKKGFPEDSSLWKAFKAPVNDLEGFSKGLEDPLNDLEGFSKGFAQLPVVEVARVPSTQGHAPLSQISAAQSDISPPRSLFSRT
jgi:hypothetical protein